MLISIIVTAVVLVISNIDWLSSKLRELFGCKPPDEDTINAPEIASMSEFESKKMEETAEVINSCFNGPIVESIQNMTPEERIQISNDMISQLSELYGIKLDNVIYSELDPCHMGYYSFKDNTITLNVLYLLSNQKEAIKEYIDTIIHELKHAVQWQILHDQIQVDWEISEERQKEWLENFMDYKSANRSRKLYRNQPVERNSFAFAYGSMKGVNL